MVRSATLWLNEEPSLVAARIAYLIREKGVDTRRAVCVRLFPDTVEPTSGVIITPQGSIYQFSYNHAGMVFDRAVIDEWINITKTFMDHPWRDEILTGLTMVRDRAV